jgi:hypothetical protein
MKWTLGAVLVLATTPSASGAARRPILYDPVALNIGVSCHWQSRCMERQRAAMTRGLSYVAKRKPSQSLVHLCNRNASRGGGRIDWVGFDHCIRNPVMKRRSR